MKSLGLGVEVGEPCTWVRVREDPKEKVWTHRRENRCGSWRGSLCLIIGGKGAKEVEKQFSGRKRSRRIHCLRTSGRVLKGHGWSAEEVAANRTSHTVSQCCRHRERKLRTH